MNTYIVKRVAADAIPALSNTWDDPVWQQANTAKLGWSWPGSEGALPTVEARVLHDGHTIYGIYRVQDHSVLACVTKFNGMVCRDSCVEFFFRPRLGAGYMNLEMSASGAFLCYFIRNHKRTEEGYEDFEELTPELGAKIATLGTTGVVPVEDFRDQTWQMRFQIPCAVPEHYLGPLGDLSGQTWTGNFYKCGDKLQHPHWLAWQGVPELNFHLPDSFGTFVFA